MINSFIAWLVNIISTVGYPGVMLAMFIESFFAPIPSEIILPFAGFVASKGTLNIYVIIVLASISAYLGTLPFYFIGRWGKEKVDAFLRKFGKYLFINEADLEKGYKIFAKHGNKMVFWGRVMPIIRSVISFPAGIANMNFTLFSIYTLTGTFIWSTILSVAGFFLGEKWGMVSEYVSKYESIILVLIIVVVLIFVIRGIYRIIQRRKGVIS